MAALASLTPMRAKLLAGFGRPSAMAKRPSKLRLVTSTAPKLRPTELEKTKPVEGWVTRSSDHAEPDHLILTGRGFHRVGGPK